MKHVPRTVLYGLWAPFFAGAERALLLLLQELDPARYRPYVVVGTDGEMRAQLTAAGIPNSYIELKNTEWRHPIAWLNSVRRITSVARSARASLIHSNGVPCYQPFGYAARLLRIPTVVHVRGFLPGPGYKWFLKPGFNRALFVSAGLMGHAVGEDSDTFGPSRDVIYDGAVLPDIPSESVRKARLAELLIPPDRPSVVISGQVVEVKGIWEYIEAARILTARGVAATFVVLGDDMLGNGETRRQAEAKVRELGLSDRFRFLGFRRDAATLIPTFDIAAVPSHSEPLGNATLEAMAAGRPVVGSRTGGIPEMILDGETGFLIPPKDASALAAALGRLIEDSHLRTDMGIAARKRVESVFSVPVYAQRVQQVYDQVLGIASA